MLAVVLIVLIVFTDLLIIVYDCDNKVTYLLRTNCKVLHYEHLSHCSVGKPRGGQFVYFSA